MTRLYQYPEVTQIFVPDATIDRWGQPANQPVQTKPFVLAAVVAMGLSFVGEPIVPPEEITVDKWYKELAEPLHAPPRLHPALQKSGHDDPDGLTRPEVTTPDKWYKELERPIFTVPRQHPPALTLVEDFVIPEDITLDKWYRDLDRPVLALPATRYYPGAFVDGLEEVPDLDWLVAFSKPEFVTTHTQVTYQFAGEPILPPEVVTLDKWYQDLAQPTVLPQQLTWPQSLAIDTKLAQADDVKLSSWYSAFAEPVIVAGQTPLYHAFVGEPIIPETITSDKWYKNFDLPVRLIARATDFNIGVNPGEPVPPPLPPSMDTWYSDLETPPARAPRAASFAPGASGFLPLPDPVPPGPVKPAWAEEAGVVTAWIEETGAVGTWAEEAAAAATWTEEDETC